MRLYLVAQLSGALLSACEPPREASTPAAERGKAPPAASADIGSDTLWLLAADPARDAVHATDDEAVLIRRYGASNVARDSIHLGEGEYTIGIVLFPRDTTRRLAIQWEDSVHFRRPTSVEIDGSPSRWLVWPGIKIGSSLKELEGLNGSPFELTGFETDYSGTVVSFLGGRLSTLKLGGQSNPRATIRLQPDEGRLAAVDTRHLVREGANPSSDPAMQALNPRVYHLSIVPR